ncbi:MAG: hypothetical protein K0S48_1417 [Ramlibacter sp.]|nr:hypothetical protein [Ramlibacter sp.]
MDWQRAAQTLRMRWQPLVNGRLFAPVGPVPLPAVGTDEEPVREAMQQLLDEVPAAYAGPLGRAIATADLPMLCLLRKPLLEALVVRHGELEGLRRVMRLDLLIRQSWPDAPVSRPIELE